MSTLVGRTVWFVYACSIKKGEVVKQNLSPDYVTVRCGEFPDYTVGTNSVFVDPQKAIHEAEEQADLLLSSAKKLQEEIWEKEGSDVEGRD